MSPMHPASHDVMRENLERWRARGARAIGGPYGGERTYLGHIPELKLVNIVDAVILDSRTPSTKLFPTQVFSLVIDETVVITGGSDFNRQVIAKFAEPINNIRNISIPLIGPNGVNFVNGTPPNSTIDSVGVLFFNLLRVDLNAGTFKLEDLTFDLAHQVVRNHTAVSSLYATAGNFRKEGNAPGNSFPSFILNQRTARAFISPSDPDILVQSASYAAETEEGASYWFYGNRDTDTRIDADTGPFTGIHLYFAPTQAAGASPEPAVAGDSANVAANFPDPKPTASGDREGRFPFVVGQPFGVVIG